VILSGGISFIPSLTRDACAVHAEAWLVRLAMREWVDQFKGNLL
jgi:hypothetical protein